MFTIHSIGVQRENTLDVHTSTHAYMYKGPSEALKHSHTHGRHWGHNEHGSYHISDQAKRLDTY